MNMQQSSEYKNVLLKLSHLQNKIDEVDCGEHLYHQFHEFHKLNGDQCPLLPIIAGRLPVNFIETEMKELVDAWERYEFNRIKFG